MAAHIEKTWYDEIRSLPISDEEKDRIIYKITYYIKDIESSHNKQLEENKLKFKKIIDKTEAETNALKKLNSTLISAFESLSNVIIVLNHVKENDSYVEIN